ncbi:DNA-methyltransferase [Microbacterium paraoxydans]|uniref:DNA-methyltransferase n=1 Tax=Microbacterium paraoxydans TaxID=199592 RepID=UPI0011A08AD6|nr:site-specific DNA-methyltransferase [Microbacterium paraoxydans]
MPAVPNFFEAATALGAVHFADDNFVLLRGDCIELLRQLPASSVDLTVTSPPYNIGKSYESFKSLDEYVAWSADWMTAVYDATAQTASFWLNVGYTPLHPSGKAVPLPYLLWNLSDFYLVQEVVWNYGAGVAGRRFLSPRNEKFLWYVKDPDNYTFNLDAIRDPDVKYPKQFKNGKLKVNPLGKNPSDVWQFPKVTSGFQRSSAERTPHPAQFPEALIERVVLASSNLSETVLDPFMGSGTSAVVALKSGRRAVGIEISGEYCDLAVSRYLAAREQQSGQLFG